MLSSGVHVTSSSSTCLGQAAVAFLSLCLTTLSLSLISLDGVIKPCAEYPHRTGGGIGEGNSRDGGEGESQDNADNGSKPEPM